MKFNPFHIILGWWFWLFNRNNHLAKERLPICVDCDDRKGFKCGVCGCPLQAKSRVRDEHCPKFKWPGDKWQKKDPEEFVID